MRKNIKGNSSMTFFGQSSISTSTNSLTSTCDSFFAQEIHVALYQVEFVKNQGLGALIWCSSESSRAGYYRLFTEQRGKTG